MLGGLPGSSKSSSSSGTKINLGNDKEDNIDISGLSDNGKWFFNSIISNSATLTDTQIKRMISQNLSSGEISSNDEKIIKSILGY